VTLLDDDLRRAVDEGAIGAAFQPQFDLAEGRIVSAEVLARWNHPERGTVPPLEFIPVAERSSLIHELGLGMLDIGWDAAEQWQLTSHPLEVSINVSAVQLTEPSFDEAVAERLATRPLPPGTITLEITESLQLFDVPQAASRLERLHALGAEVSIDDFGTGFSSIERIEELPVSEIKIDRSMVQDLSVDGHAAIAEIIGYAHDRGIRVVGEGVETVAQRDRLLDLGCDRAQGWLFGKPMPREEFERLLAA